MVIKDKLFQIKFSAKNPTNLSRQQQIVTRHEAEQDQVIEEDPGHGLLVNLWTEIYQSTPQLLRMEHFSGQLCSCRIPTKPFAVRESISHT